jgi:Flp pilus assembly protein TadG
MSGKQRRASRRRGSASVELAACLPVLALLVFGSIECCSMIFLRQAVTATAYETVRVAIHRDGTSSLAQRRATEVLSARGILSGTVELAPSEPFGVARGTLISVTVRAPCDANSFMPAWFFGGRTQSVTAKMVKE